MGIGMLLDMAVSMHGDRVLVGPRRGGLTATDLARRAERGGAEILAGEAGHVVFVGANSPAVPVTVLASALAGIPVTPLNYRLAPDALRALIGRLDAPLVIADPEALDAIGSVPHAVGCVPTEEWLSRTAEGSPVPLPPVEDTAPAVVLFTSGTTSTPKAVVLRHTNLVSYVLQTVEFGCADELEAALISLPPYHVAGIGTILTNLYAGRRVTYLSDFTASGWLSAIATEKATSAMVVPTMLARIVEHLDGKPADTPTLRSIAYGGARLPRTVLIDALVAFPDVGFTNAYGLTETSSTIAVLGPADHRAAAASDDPGQQARLGSAGRFVPGVEGQIRGTDGTPLDHGQVGELWLRGAQISGEYTDEGSILDPDGWFPTRDRGRLDTEGYLYIEGRSDDTIIRGGENISPAEIEDVLTDHPDIHDVAVFGTHDDHWGDRIVAALVLHPDRTEDPEAYRDWVRARLRSSRTPDQVVFLTELPYSPTGKLLRRELARVAAHPTGGS